jgi:hypothetical protein
MDWERVRGKKYMEVAHAAGWLRLEVDRALDGKWIARVGRWSTFKDYETVEAAKSAAFHEAVRKVEAAHAALLSKGV